MCGELEDWQRAEPVTVRLETSANQARIVLPKRLENVEKVVLDEVFFAGYNGGVSGASYLFLDQPGFRQGVTNNESQKGILLAVDALNPHTVYQRPRVISLSHMGFVNEFFLSLTLPSGAAVAFTEATFMMTFICRKSPDEHAATRKMKGLQPYPPSIVDVANTYHP